MLFNSFEFIFLFLPISAIVYFWLSRLRMVIAAKGWLSFASLFFYSWWNIVYLPLILGSILFNFVLGGELSKLTAKFEIKKSKKVLVVAIALNILLLIYFKYMDFFISNINDTFGFSYELLHVVLPLGISFFTFTQIAFLVDCYKGEVKERSYLNYILFVTFFPHLLAGPILHHKEMMPQFDRLKNKLPNYKNLSVGLFLFSVGLFKKVIVADTFAKWANVGFEAAHLNMLEAWITSLSYTFQLYFDFSGYTDMALGTALIFNIKLPINFNSPYKALSIQDFWRRWHITLSRFLRDYIYIPLGGNKKSEASTYSNLFTVFLIGGIWHGAGWMFVIWGSLHGAAIVAHRFWSLQVKPFVSDGIKASKLYVVAAWFLTFNFINITWVFFRAHDLDSAMRIISAMFGITSADITFNKDILSHIDAKPDTLLIVIAAFVVSLYFKNSNYYATSFTPNKKYLYATVVLFLFGVLNINKYQVFLYFNF